MKKTNLVKHIKTTGLALFAMVILAFAVPQTTQAATNPSIAVSSVTNLTSTNAQINATVKNPSRMRLRKCGYILYSSNGKVISNRYDNINYTYSSFNA